MGGTDIPYLERMDKESENQKEPCRLAAIFGGESMTDERENKHEYYTMLPNCIIRDMGLSYHEIAVYALIISRAGWEKGGYCSESQNHIAKRLHMARQTLSRTVKKLTDKGLIRGYKAMHPRTLNIQNIYLPEKDIWEKNSEYCYKQTGSGEWQILGPAFDDYPVQNETGGAQFDQGDDESENRGYDEFEQGADEFDAGGAQNTATNNIPESISLNDIPGSKTQEGGLSPSKTKEQEPAVLEVETADTIQDIYVKRFREPLTETIAEQLNTLVETLSFTATEKAIQYISGRYISGRQMSFEYVPNQAAFYYSQELETVETDR